MRILVIEDESSVSEYIANGLKQSGHVVDTAPDGKEGLFLASTGSYDAMIIDRMIPQLDGLALIRTLRAGGNQTPVLILSAMGEVDDRVLGLRSGGDDYLVKPFAFSELLARIEILGRRTTGLSEKTQLSAGDLHMDMLARKVTRAGTAIDLQTREFRLLEYLLRHKGQVITRTMLLENVWDYHFDPQTNVIDVHISRLRSKINAGHKTHLIRTVRGAGYIIEDPS
ncbi:MAG: DNA-binding response regulator [Proteobacteria bacterium]|nr:DNA-binding response regulator [Pseudomonadota bacterium]